MTENSSEFLAEYQKSYSKYNKQPDFGKCAQAIFQDIWMGAKQCTRKNGHGPHGAWCKQHDPEAVNAQRRAQEAKWRREWDAKKLDATLRAEALTIIRQISEGHNDPASLCRDWCNRWDSK